MANTPIDIAVERQKVGVSTTLATPIYLSLLSWARAQPGDNVQDGAELYGWWGDAYADVPDEFGSRLWTLLGQPIPLALPKAAPLALDALQWLVEDGLVTDLQVTASDVGGNTIELAVTGVPVDSSLDTHLATVKLVLS